MKKVQIIIISLVVVLTLVCGIFAILYFATDTFKSEQELFYKYIGQIDLKEFADLESYNNYLNRVNTERHSSNGELGINLIQGDEVINETITYNGYSDPANKKASSQIAINMNEENLLTINYLKNQDLYGVQFQNLINQYIVVENNNLKQFAAKLGVTNLENIPDKIETTQEPININYEEIKSILNKYLSATIEQIPEDKYSKIEKTSISVGNAKIDADGYELTLGMEDLRKILISCLEKAKNDQETYNLVNRTNNISFEDYQNIIDEMLSNTSEEISDEENLDAIKISVYKQGKDTIKLLVSILPENDENFEISIDRNSNGLMLSETMRDTTIGQEINIVATKTVNTEEQENLDVNIIIKENNQEIGNYNINLNRAGSLTSSNVTNNISFNTSSNGTDININLKNTTDFSANQEIADFTEGNYLIINNLSQEQINNLFTNLGTMLAGRLQNEIITSTVSYIVNKASQGMENALEQTLQETQAAIEEESNLINGTVTVNGQTVPVDDYIN